MDTRSPGDPPRRRRTAALVVVALLLPAAAQAQTAPRPAAAPRPAPEPAPPGWVGFWYEVAAGRDGRPVVVVGRVEEGSPAERAGLGTGDTLLAVGGHLISPPTLRVLGRGLQAGDPLRLTVRRDGRRRDLEVVAAPRPGRLGSGPAAFTDSAHRALLAGLDSLRTRVLLSPPPAGAPRVLPPPPPEPEGPPPFHAFVWSAADSLVGRPEALEAEERAARLAGARRPRAWASRPLTPYIVGQDRAAGARLTPLNEGLAPYFGTGRGLLVVEVAPGTPAHEAGLVPGDVLTAVADAPLAGMADLRDALSAAGAGPIVLRVLRKRRVFDVRLP